MMKRRVLYVEDEPYLARIVRETLSAKGYEVLHLKDGSRIADQIQSFAPDICLLDIMLPHIDGFTLGTYIRNLYPQLPIIFLTAKSDPDDIVQGFASGGTDYLRKPFSMTELMARINNQLRLVQQQTALSLPDMITLKSFTFYPNRLELHYQQDTRRLSHRENHILSILCQHRQKILDRNMLLQAVWGDNSYFNSRNLDVYIRKLRSYFAIEPAIQIITLKGQGYLFACP